MNDLFHIYGEYEKAIADYTHAIELDSEFVISYWGLGNVYYDMGEYENSIAAYREYERINGELEPFMVERIAEMEAALNGE